MSIQPTVLSPSEAKSVCLKQDARAKQYFPIFQNFVVQGCPEDALFFIIQVRDVLLYLKMPYLLCTVTHY